MPWYPKDWWTSDTFFELTNSQRYLYLELLFMMYMNIDSQVKNDRIFIGRKLSTEFALEDWIAVIKRLITVGNFLTSDSVKKRRLKADTSRENGQLGGRPPKPNNPAPKPKEKPKITHLLEEKEKENRNRTEPNTVRYEGSEVDTGGGDGRGTLPPFRAVAHDQDIAHKLQVYGQRFRDTIKSGRVSATNGLAALVFFWPNDPGAEMMREVEKEIGSWTDASVWIIDLVRAWALNLDTWGQMLREGRRDRFPVEWSIIDFVRLHKPVTDE